MRSEFWDERYADERYAYGTEPSPFVQREADRMPPEKRPALYGLIQRLTRPGGIPIAEWFRPEQITGSYNSGGPRSSSSWSPPTSCANISRRRGFAI